MSTLRHAVYGGFAALLALSSPASYAVEALADGLYAVIHTPRGVITAELFPEKAPLTVANFVGLAEGTIPFEGRQAGAPFYDGLTFYRVVPGFVIQGGDPPGNDDGGPGYMIPDEFTAGAKHVRGALAMANSGPNTNGSAFYFAINEVHRLNYKHTVFGVVHTGMEVVTAIEQGDPMERVEIVRVGDGARQYRVTPESFAALREAARVISPRDQALPPLFEDNGVELGLPGWFPQWIADKLHHYHQVRGPQIFVRLVRKFSDLPGEGRESLPALHAQLAGDDMRSCLLVYIGEESSWRLWLGDSLVPLFGVQPADKDTEEGRSVLHAVKAEILAPAKAEIEAGGSRRSIDAAVTSLIERLDSIPGSH